MTTKFEFLILCHKYYSFFHWGSKVKVTLKSQIFQKYMSDLIWTVSHCQAIPDLDHVKLHRIQENDEGISRIWQSPHLLWGVHTQQSFTTHGRSILPTFGLPWDIQFHIIFWVVAAIHSMILSNNETPTPKSI